MIDLDEVLSGRTGGAGVRAMLRSPVRRQALLSLLPPSVELGRCRLERVKFKPRRKLTACYRVYLGGPGGGLSRAVAVSWVPREALPGADDDTRAHDVEVEVRERGLAAPFVGLRATVAEHGMRLQIAPFDPRFPQLVRLTDPAHVSMLLAGAGVAPGGSTTTTGVSTVRFRPGERHVLRYGVVDDGDRREVFAKLQDAERGTRAAGLAAGVADVLAVHPRLAAGVAPALHVPEDGVVLYPRVPGTPLSRLLVGGSEAAARHLGRAGELLRVLHGHGDVLVAGLRERSHNAEVALTARASEHLEDMLVPLGARIRSLLGRAGDVLAASVPDPAGFAHGDYKADHLLVGPASLALLDFDSCHRAEPALDLGKFLADLTWWLQGRGGSEIAGAQERFLLGYGVEPASPTVLRAHAYEAILLVRAAARRLRVDRPDWAARAELVVERAEHVLAVPVP